jgi:aminopeptidase N
LYGGGRSIELVFPNYQDYGYGIFLLDDKSRDYVLKNIQNEKDPFLRSMMWGALWDSVREGELDPKVYVELVVKVLSPGFSRPANAKTPKGVTLNGGTRNGEDETTIAVLLGRASTAMTYYMSEPPASAGGRTPDLRERFEKMLTERMQNATTAGQRITYYRAFLNIARSDNSRNVLKEMLKFSTTPSAEAASTPPYQGGEFARIPLKTKDKFDIVTRLLILNDPDALKLLAELEKTETSDEAKRYAYAAKAGVGTAENKAKYWNDLINNKIISESWIESALGPFNSIEQSDITLPYLEKALNELPNLKRDRKIFFVNGWLGAFLGGQRSEAALNIVNKFLADNPKLDNDLRLKILENADTIERAVKIRMKF